jgi:hypothetical protein
LILAGIEFRKNLGFFLLVAKSCLEHSSKIIIPSDLSLDYLLQVTAECLQLLQLLISYVCVQLDAEKGAS